jgi:sugar lactone lactonase YvrE
MNPEPLDCNGLAIAPTGQWFVIGDSAGRRVVMMDVIEGTGRNARTLIDFLPPAYPRDLSKTQQQELTTRNVAMPDGMVFDEFGRLYLATGQAGTVVVVEVPSGRVLATYALGVGEVRNLHFHNGDLYVTAGRGLYKLPLGVRGWRYSRGCGW